MGVRSAPGGQVRQSRCEGGERFASWHGVAERALRSCVRRRALFGPYKGKTGRGRAAELADRNASGGLARARKEGGGGRNDWVRRRPLFGPYKGMTGRGRAAELADRNASGGLARALKGMGGGGGGGLGEWGWME
jgi:hypothetical protein